MNQKFEYDEIIHEIPENGGAYVIFPWDMYISDKLTILHGQSDHLSRRFRSLISERDSRRSKSFL